MAEVVAWHNRTLYEHQVLRDQSARQGYRFLSLSIYGQVAAPFYAAVMIRRPTVVEQRDWPLMTADQWQQTFDQQAAQGFGPVILAATGQSWDPRFAAVFERQDPIPLTRHALTSRDPADPADQATIQGMNEAARSQGLILRWAASYGTLNERRFAAIWVPNAGNVLWNNDGVMDDAGSYQARFDAETSVWCRPAFVTLDGDDRYLSLFVADDVGPWEARHNLTPADYQTAFDTLRAKSYFPICVQAAGSSDVSARFAALFAKGEDRVARRASATGPVANLAIDAIVQETMGEYPATRHGSLAIVQGKRLVYARAYTFAEPSWPIVQPTTRFRLASVSKTITALAVLTLIEHGLQPSDTLQSILQLETPSGGAPMDLRFGTITIKNLLEHKSGLDPDAFAQGDEVVKAFKNAGRPAGLPVTQEMTDSYIAGQQLVHDPGAVQQYSNCGYYLLGRVVAKLWGTAEPIEAYRAWLFGPLGITRIRPAVDLVSAQPPDEARYQAATMFGDVVPNDLQVARSLQTPNRPLVASGYGDYELAMAQGAGGLSAATTDVARLIAILIDQSDNPALQRATINSMLTAAATLSVDRKKDRAGYGLDWAIDRHDGSFYGQKGGQIRNAASVLKFDGEWGFALCWGSPGYSGLASPGPVYPDYEAVMSIARNTDWGTTDLFPQFGMPSL